MKSDIEMARSEKAFDTEMHAREARCRKISMETQPIGYSNRVINYFVECVNQMNRMVLVPSRLRDISVTSAECRTAIPAGADLFQHYQMLNSVKNDLLDGSSSMMMFSDPNMTSNHHVNGKSANGFDNYSYRRHHRQPSDESVSGPMSSSSSTVSSMASDNDESAIDTPTAALTTALMEHLQSIHTILHCFAASAEYIAQRYIEDVEGCERLQ